MSYKIKKVKEFIKKVSLDEALNHGTAIAKVDISNIKKGDGGIITAYLPDMEKFAVMFKEQGWITFTGSEEWFLEHFERVQ